MNCIIVHGCPGSEEQALNPADHTYAKHWLPWLQGELIKNGIPTEIPMMPQPWAPNYAAFQAVFAKYPISEDTVLVGHSCGTAFLVRWLGESKRAVRQLILVAPWKVPDDPRPGRQAFYDYEIDPTIPTRVGQIVTFTSNDESAAGKESLKIFHDVLGGQVISLPEHGHYTQDDMGTTEFPELLTLILSEGE